MNNKIIIRRTMRQLRNNLSQQQQQDAAQQAATHLVATVQALTAKHVALYLANDGELDPLPAIEQLTQLGVNVYIPRLHPFSKGHLQFYRYQPQQLTTNHYGIAEPMLDIQQLRPISQLDLVITPLVAFDQQGHRLGMGGGYYDRSLAIDNRPTVIGYGHDCQQLPQIPTEIWDIPLSQVITPKQILHFNR